MQGQSRLKPADKETIERMLGPQVSTADIEKMTQPGEVDEVAFELYKEAIRVLILTSHMLDESAVAQGGFSRNQAICAGLIIRMGKFMTAVVQLSATEKRGEVVLALNRSILESAVNLEFLLRAGESQYFDRFVEFSLGPERELYDLTQENISARGGKMWAIEESMLRSIDRVCSASGLKIDAIQRKHRDWGDNLRERMKAIGKEHLYAALRISSHAVHGTWVDLLFHHLRHIEGKDVFTPETDWSSVDERLLGPVAILVLDAVEVYIQQCLIEGEERDLLLDRTRNLRDRHARAGRAHETLMARNWRSENPSAAATATD